jgi:SAM-dependent methyltransferase
MPGAGADRCGIIVPRPRAAPIRIPMRRRPADFDEAFFERYYGDPATRVADGGDAERLAGLVAGVVRYIELPVRRILDAGCGVGLLKDPLLARFPTARYEGLEYSAYLCRRHGWIEGSLATHVASQPYDLVVCHDVLQYLDDRTAARALANLARLCRGALYFSVLTRRDWRHAADQSRTDRTVHLRPADWYRRRLRRGFRHVAGGVHVARALDPILWELEQPWR